jgi:hypothetical protein
LIDKDLSILYETDVRSLNQAVKRNIKRFPGDFMFQLTSEEWESIRSQVEAAAKRDDSLISQSVISNSPGRGGARTLPYAFTEQGVAMLSGILNSDRAISMNIAIMRAFVEVRRIMLQQNDLRLQLQEIKERLGSHDAQLNQIYDAMENLLDEKAAERKWDDRERIGFKQR